MEGGRGDIEQNTGAKVTERMIGEALKDIIAEGSFEGEVKFLEPMSKHTSLRIGGPADIFVEPHNVESLSRLLHYVQKQGMDLFPLGAGTNVLVKDGGIAGAVVRFSAFRHIETVGEDGEFVHLSVGAGTFLQRLVAYAKEKGYSGIEGLVGIPGTVGGALCGNAGSFGYEIKDVFISADIMKADGVIHRVWSKDISFRYRESDILPTDLLLSAEIKLKKGEKEDIKARIEHFMKVKRQRQPIWEASAGCVFKNPVGLSAGKVIDEAGCKGMKVGDVMVSDIHANFFINTGKASAADFISLMHEVVGRVFSTFGITLEPEIKIVGRDNAHE